MVCFFQLFFIKCSNNFFILEIINNICLWHCIFNFFNYKNFFRPIWSISFSQNVLYFDILAWSPTWNLWSLSLTSLLKSIYIYIYIYIIYNINRLHFNCSMIWWYGFLYSFTISSNLSIHAFFKIYLLIAYQLNQHPKYCF